MTDDLPHDPELATRLEEVEAAALFEDRRRWPGSALHLKRYVGDIDLESPTGMMDNLQVGWMERGMGPVVLRAGEAPLVYETFEDAARDGWRPG